MINDLEATKTCVYPLRTGKPCGRRAVEGSDPPACKRHAGKPAAVPPRHLYAAGMTAGELSLLVENGPAADLSAELALVRAVLIRLLARLDDPAYVLLPDDLRQLASLIFSGARTVATLLRQQRAGEGDLQPWLARALDELAAGSNLEV